jgi:hypothetical protein
MRHEDSPDLFGCGIGSGTCGDITCDLCKVTHNEGNDKRADEEGDCVYLETPSVLHTRFAGLTVCDCCFEKIENEIERRMRDILPWWRKIQEERSQRIKGDLSLLDRIQSNEKDEGPLEAAALSQHQNGK